MNEKKSYIEKFFHVFMIYSLKKQSFMSFPFPYFYLLWD